VPEVRDTMITPRKYCQTIWSHEVQISSQHASNNRILKVSRPVQFTILQLRVAASCGAEIIEVCRHWPTFPWIRVSTKVYGTLGDCGAGSRPCPGVLKLECQRIAEE
jgi:hypothetical protein